MHPEGGDALAVGGEPSGGDGAAGCAESVDQSHTLYHEQPPQGGGEESVDGPHARHALGQPRVEFALLGAGEFGLVEASGPEAEPSQQGHDKEQQSQSPYPLGQGTVGQDGGRQLFGMPDDRRPCGGEAAEGLEERVGERLCHPGKEVGQGTEQGHDHPCCNGEPVALVLAEPVFGFAAHHVAQEQAGHKYQHARDGEGKLHAVALVDGQHQGQQQPCCKVEQQHAGDLCNQFPVEPTHNPVEMDSLDMFFRTDGSGVLRCGIETKKTVWIPVPSLWGGRRRPPCPWL